jgi:hypothetical protein
MKTEPTPTAAAELLAEWKALVASIGMTQPSEYPFIMEISAQLDEMCEHLDIQDGAFAFLVEMPSAPDKVRKELIGELIALLQWLLIKENHGK